MSVKVVGVDTYIDLRKLVRWAVVLCGVYFLCQIVADVAASKMVSVGNFVMPAGTFIYAITFTVRDLIQKRLGYKVALLTIFAAGAFNVAMALYFMFTVRMPTPPFAMEGAAAYASVVGIAVPRIVIASIIAELVSELVDTGFYELWQNALGQRLQWGRVVASNAVSVPIDSFAFGFLAFYGVFPVGDIVALAIGQIVLKYFVSLCGPPLLIYLVPRSPEADALDGRT
jgi:uncharacterized integral membrane protein (TIGR00697 family)